MLIVDINFSLNLETKRFIVLNEVLKIIGKTKGISIR